MAWSLDQPTAEWWTMQLDQFLNKHGEASKFDFRIRGEKLPPTPAHVHGHPYFQLHVVLEGAGDSCFGDCTRPLQRGSVCFVNVGQSHLVRRSRDHRGYIVDFMPSFYQPNEAARNFSKSSELRPFLYQRWIDFRLSDVLTIECNELLRAIEREAHRIDASTAVVRSYLTILISQIAREYSDQIDDASNRHALVSRHRAVEKVLRLIDESYHRQMTLDDAVEVACLSSAYLSHLITTETGKSFTELLTDKRMERSRDLLAHTNMRVSEVARAVGYEDENYFSKRFKQVCRSSPSEFRLAALRKH